jgi:hypothetical protein
MLSLLFSALGIKPKALNMGGKHITNELHFQPSFHVLMSIRKHSRFFGQPTDKAAGLLRQVRETRHL